MSVPVKTAGRTLLAWQDVTTGAVAVGAVLDVSTLYGGNVFVQLGRRSGVAFTAGQPNVRIQASPKASGTDCWLDAVVFQPNVGASIVNTTLNGAVSAGATSFTLTSATNVAVGDVLFLKGDTDAGNELVKVKTVAGAVITPWEAVTNAHASGNAVTDQAEEYQASLDLTGIVRLRAVVENASGQTVAVQVLVSTWDSQ
jgi:hypothetical protein